MAILEMQPEDREPIVSVWFDEDTEAGFVSVARVYEAVKSYTDVPSSLQSRLSEALNVYIDAEADSEPGWAQVADAIDSLCIGLDVYDGTSFFEVYEAS